MSKDSDQTKTATREFKLGPLGNLNQVIKALGVTIRAMADGTLDSQVGARICNGLGIMRACLETQTMERLEERMDEIADRAVANAGEAASPKRMAMCSTWSAASSSPAAMAAASAGSTARNRPKTFTRMVCSASVSAYSDSISCLTVLFSFMAIVAERG